MAAIDFPNSPTEGTTHTVGSTVWIYTSGTWVIRQTNQVLYDANGVARVNISTSGTVTIGSGSTSGYLSLHGNSTPSALEGGQIDFVCADSLGQYSIDTYSDDMRFLTSTTAGNYSFLVNNNTQEAFRIQADGTARFYNGIRENQYNLTGTIINPTNGTIQYKTLAANTTFTETFSDGDYVTLMITNGSNYTVTWPTMTWVGGSAPTLETTGYNVIEIWKVNSVLYGAYVGAA